MDFLISKSFNFEVRTTLHRDLLNEEDINFMINYLKNRGYSKSYFLQNFLETEDNIGGLKASILKFNKSKLLSDLKIIWRD